MANGSVFQNLKTDIVKNFEVIRPDDETLASFQKTIAPLFGLMEARQQESKQLAELREALLPKLVSGEIDVTRIDLTQLNSHLLEIDVTLEVLDRCIEIAVRTVVCVHVWMVSQEMRNTLIEVSYELS